MLREKELFIKELQDAVLHHLQVKTSYWYSSWKRRQDYMLDKMYQVNIILTKPILSTKYCVTPDLVIIL